jgi:hypothetical protein
MGLSPSNGAALSAGYFLMKFQNQLPIEGSIIDSCSHLTNFDIFEIYRKTQDRTFLEQSVDENWLQKMNIISVSYFRSRKTFDSIHFVDD